MIDDNDASWRAINDAVCVVEILEGVDAAMKLLRELVSPAEIQLATKFVEVERASSTARPPMVLGVVDSTTGRGMLVSTIRRLMAREIWGRVREKM